ncbi:glycosyltransferase family 4 protein [Desulfobulbus rhabdoformis]|uniref:glycosyltransferase n=1 Tax=Desulfobulbus rhabdoformis TaxID=34032 RepID=UPI0019654300|nr:glycosyltransferase [Desulfobulbus rhabdoformis]MBM9615842.1 glycosyltransferase family 4 protein [Desulfobulbus rhabdoformis]
MRVALVHYHLQSGGVTRIICHVLKALRARGIQCMVLTGKEPGFNISGTYRVVPGLQYELDRPKLSVQALTEQMRSAATEALGGAPDLWHVHNHSLGKSLLLPLALRQMASEGEHFLFHIHDFAEDGRPANYRAMLQQMAGGQCDLLASQLYPQGDHVHYAVLNTRDHCYLQEAGLDEPQLHLLPNPVDLGKPSLAEAPLPGKLPLWLYPTRAIRRKNLGEFLLWSALVGETTWFATTSAPENPLEQPRYQRWKQIAAELGLPVHFELVGPNGYGFIDLLRLADMAMTTSVAEGFGMAFLEPWTQTTPVCGRNLVEITRQFAIDALELPGCYDQLTVPLDWLGEERVRKAAASGLCRNLAAYGRQPGKDDLERCLQAWIKDGRIDFGRLDEPMQEDVLSQVVGHQAQAALVSPADLPDSATMAAALNKNQEILQRQYTLERYGERLEQIYDQVAGAAGSFCGQLDGGVLLDRFLAPERLHLLRVD